jgi:hypothetical protein
MKEFTTMAAVIPVAIVEEAWQEVGASFERFCLTAGIATLANMMEEDAARLCGPRYGRAAGKDGHRWGKTKGKVGFHGGKVEVERPRVRARVGGEIALPSWETAYPIPRGYRKYSPNAAQLLRSGAVQPIIISPPSIAFRVPIACSRVGAADVAIATSSSCTELNPHIPEANSLATPSRLTN